MSEFTAGEFKQGFLAEASEHLERLSQNLLLLEQGFTSGGPAGAPGEITELLMELFRSFHTLKGLCGMVGLEAGTQLSHRLETVLQHVQKDQARLSQEVIDLLFSGTSTLAAIFETVRSPDNPLPDMQADLVAIERLIAGGPDEGDVPESGTASRPAGGDIPPPQGSPQVVETLFPGLATYPELVSSLGPLEKQKIQAAAQAGQLFALVIFVPSLERAAKGENVDLIRQNIQATGQLIKAVPVMEDGKIRFLFLVAMTHPLDPAILRADEIIPLAVNAPLVARQSGVSAAGSGWSPSLVNVVRVELERLDELLHFTSDLVTLRMRLVDQLDRLDAIPRSARRSLYQTTQQMGTTLRGLRQAILRARLVPLAETLNHMPLVVRDLSRATQKDLRLTIRGETTEVDKLLVERLFDPLIHLVRNAIIHGIELPAERVAAGKPPQGELILQARREGDHILIEVTDDGRGIDLETVAQEAVRLGWLEPGETVDSEDALELITRAGFSTQTRADMAAGRGIGLDVVRRMVNSFRGSLAMDTTPGKGTTFLLRLPFTLVIIEGVLVRSGAEQYVIPRDMVERVQEIDPDSVIQVEKSELLADGEDYFVLYRLSRLIDVQSNNHPPSRCLYGLILSEIAGSKTGREMIVVDELLDMREIVVEAVTDPLVARAGVGGATEMGDGRVVLILDLPALLRIARKE